MAQERTGYLLFERDYPLSGSAFANDAAIGGLPKLEEEVDGVAVSTGFTWDCLTVPAVERALEQARGVFVSHAVLRPDGTTGVSIAGHGAIFVSAAELATKNIVVSPDDLATYETNQRVTRLIAKGAFGVTMPE